MEAKKGLILYIFYVYPLGISLVVWERRGFTPLGRRRRAGDVQKSQWYIPSFFFFLLSSCQNNLFRYYCQPSSFFGEFHVYIREAIGREIIRDVNIARLSQSKTNLVSFFFISFGFLSLIQEVSYASRHVCHRDSCKSCQHCQNTRESGVIVVSLERR